jgi:hypothetical protein
MALIGEAIATWDEVTTTANENVQGALGDSKTATEELTTASDGLKNKINDEVLPAI